MRAPGGSGGCGPLLDLDQVRRQLRLGSPVPEGTETIAVAQIVGTAGRARDFDGCFHPMRAELRKRIGEIEAAEPATLDEPIEVVRVDRAYFVVDGHKRVAIARRVGREFLDARVTRLPSPYAFDARVEEESIERTAREGEFRRHSGLAEGVPAARFAVADTTGYGELLIAVQSYAFDRVLAVGRALTAADAARTWYEEKYLPTVAVGRAASTGLLDSSTDADLFLMVHRQERASWGGACEDTECVADMLLAEQRRIAAAARSPLDRLLHRDPAPVSAPALLLPSADEEEASGRDS